MNIQCSCRYLFLRFPFFGDVSFAASPDMVVLAVAAVTVAETPRESAVRAVAMPLSFKIVPWVVAA